MYVEKCLNNGTEYLRLVKSQRVLNSNGKKTVRKKVIFNIGPLSKFDDNRLPFTALRKRAHLARPHGDNRANRGRPHGFAHRLESAPGGRRSICI